MTTLALALLATPAAVRAHEGAPEAVQTPPPEIARTFVYYFRGNELDPRRWKVIQRAGARNGPSPEMQYYTPEAVVVDRGVLHLSAGRVDGVDPTDGWEYQYTSGRVESAQTILYGRIDVRMKVPIGDGLWPAVWLRTPPGAGPLNGQLDIFDGFGSHTDGMTASIDTWMRGRLIAQNCVIVENYAAQTRCKRIGNPLHRRVNFAKDFHTFSVDWQPDHVTWFVDRIPYWTVTNNVPNVPMVLVMDVAVGGIQDGPPGRGTKLGAALEIASITITR